MDNPNLFWLDLETTGLDADTASILEAGVVVTNNALDTLFEASTLVHFDVHGKWAELPERVRQMHTENGLWQDLLDPTIPKVAPESLGSWLGAIADACGCSRGPEILGAPLCGSTINFDRAFLRVYAPELLSRLDYHNVDVSSVHELGKRWFDTHHSDGKGAHRALADIHFSIDRLRWYRVRHFNAHGRKVS